MTNPEEFNFSLKMNVTLVFSDELSKELKDKMLFLFGKGIFNHFEKNKGQSNIRFSYKENNMELVCHFPVSEFLLNIIVLQSSLSAIINYNKEKLNISSYWKGDINIIGFTSLEHWGLQDSIHFVSGTEKKYHIIGNKITEDGKVLKCIQEYFDEN